MPIEWVTVYSPHGSPPALVNRKAYENDLKAKGFRLRPIKSDETEDEQEKENE